MEASSNSGTRRQAASLEVGAVALLDALVDALGRIHRARGREPLRVEGDEGACRVAALVVRRVVLVDSSAAAEPSILDGVSEYTAGVGWLSS